MSDIRIEWCTKRVVEGVNNFQGILEASTTWWFVSQIIKEYINMEDEEECSETPIIVSFWMMIVRLIFSGIYLITLPMVCCYSYNNNKNNNVSCECQ